MDIGITQTIKVITVLLKLMMYYFIHGKKKLQ